MGGARRSSRPAEATDFPLYLQGHRGGSRLWARVEVGQSLGTATFALCLVLFDVSETENPWRADSRGKVAGGVLLRVNGQAAVDHADKLSPLGLVCLARSSQRENGTENNADRHARAPGRAAGWKTRKPDASSVGR